MTAAAERLEWQEFSFWLPSCLCLSLWMGLTPQAGKKGLFSHGQRLSSVKAVTVEVVNSLRIETFGVFSDEAEKGL